MFKKRVGLFLIPLLLIAGLAFGYTRSWDETDPIDHSKNSTWPAEIREVMVDVAERLDDIMNGFGSSDTVTDFNLVPINNRAADPSAVADTGIIYTKDVDSKAELFWIDEDGDTKQLTSGGEFIGGFTGEIRMWYGAIADIPAGWELADGSCTNSCPDLTNKFIVGADADDGGVAKSTITGSALASYTQTAATADSHTLTIAEIPSHTHEITAKSGGALGAVADWSTHPDTAEQQLDITTGSTGGGGGHTHTVTSGNHIPTFYALCYIIKI